MPLHIDTTSFTGGQTQNSLWRRLNKRQLPIFILLTILFFSLFLNIIQHNKRKTPAFQVFSSHDALPPIPLTEYHHAIIVAGHAIYTGPDDIEQLTNDKNWILESYQQGGQVNTFIQHIQKGVDVLKQDEKSVLIFSGYIFTLVCLKLTLIGICSGETRPNAGPRSEAFSYWHIAQSLLHQDDSVSAEVKASISERMITEEYAKDSHENLLFSICRFSEMTGNYPNQISVVGFEFKRKRFEDIHRYSIGYPVEQ